MIETNGPNPRLSDWSIPESDEMQNQPSFSNNSAEPIFVKQDYSKNHQTGQ
jgi:hypothetical protein